MSFFDGGFGDIASGVLGALGGAAGSALDAAHDRDIARMNANFQREVYQNQLQWKAADARKAGLHPLAALGGGSYSASNIASSSGTSFAQSLGKLGEGIGDAFTAYMNKDEIQAMKDKARAADDREERLQNAQIAHVEAQTQESLARAASYTKPRATGREPIKGQVDMPEGFEQPKQRTGLISNPKSAIHVWYMGNGQYDITYNPDYTQAIGDEIGQFVNALKAGTRPARYHDVDLDRVFYYNPDTGYYQDIDPAVMKAPGGGGAAGAWTSPDDGEPFAWAKWMDRR